ncbi:sulfite exporter TauE/SafE family protein [candidate division KSB1 bacterium]|nr:sulfite exporter TauE/SafE family protein [candidate division KSB1 bacterium]
MPEILKLLIFFAVGIIVGFINILAGGGSLLSLPVLIYFGLPTAVANGTNRVAIIMQNFIGVLRFHQFKVLPWRLGIYAAITGVIGATIGANIAVDVPDALFKRLLAGVMVVVLIIILIDPSKRMAGYTHQLHGWAKLWFALAFFGVGFYVGFIQAGVGFIVITVGMFAGFDLVRTNALKIFLIFIFTIMALGIFIWHGQVNYLYGFTMGLGNSLGAWWSSKAAVKKGHGWVRGFVLVMGGIFAVKLFFDSLN